MSITLKTHKLLWGQSGNRCAICNKELCKKAEIEDIKILIGEECHIVAKSENGPRGKNVLPMEKRDELSNLILLCKNHHSMIDKNIKDYPVETLIETKKKHEERVKNSLSKGIDNDILQFQKTIDFLTVNARFDDWDNSFSGIVYGTYLCIEKDYFKSMKKLDDYLFRRFPITKFATIENEIDNFRLIIHDFINVYGKHINFSLDTTKNDTYYTTQFYKIKKFDKRRYYDLLDKYNFHSDLIEDLIFELTRSANRIVEMIRKDISPIYRQKEGYLILRRGMNLNLKECTYKFVYSSEKESYPGLEEFSKIRTQRNERMGFQGDKYIKDYL